MTQASIPTCIGVIMDGNRRFAKERGLPSLAGHKAGYEKLKEVLRWAKGAGVSTIIAYAFSTENWKRANEEVSYLLDIFRLALSNEIDSLMKEGVQLRFIGDLSLLPPDLQEKMKEAEEKTKAFKECTLALAVSYGGRREILQAAQAFALSSPAEQREISEETLGRFLATHDLPDPDMIIRTGGEMRLSNFLLWQSAYSELFFTKTLWPAFTKDELLEMFGEFASRKRNLGK